MYPEEWVKVGLPDDTQGYRLVEYMYKLNPTGSLHEHLTDVLKPSTLLHISNIQSTVAAGWYSSRFIVAVAVC